MFSCISPEERVPRPHPFGTNREMADKALKELSPRFDGMYAKTGRPSIAPEKLLRALPLRALYAIRSERMLMEQLDYNLLFCWFVRLNMDAVGWVPIVFTKNRDRRVDGNIVEVFFQQMLDQAREDRLLSDEHFSADGTLAQAWARQKSFRKKDNTEGPKDSGASNPTVNSRGEKRSNQTHASTTAADARLARKNGGQEAKLTYTGNAMIESRNGFVVYTDVLLVAGTAKRDAAMMMAERLPGNDRVTIGANRGYDTRDLVAEIRGMSVTPHVAQNTNGRSGAIDGPTTRHVD